MIVVIEYGDAKRFYDNETVQAVNLNLDATQQIQRSHHALYNYAANISALKVK